jgi:hypothetical protein
MIELSINAIAMEDKNAHTNIKQKAYLNNLTFKNKSQE